MIHTKVITTVMNIFSTSSNMDPRTRAVFYIKYFHLHVWKPISSSILVLRPIILISDFVSLFSKDLFRDILVVVRPSGEWTWSVSDLHGLFLDSKSILLTETIYDPIDILLH